MDRAQSKLSTRGRLPPLSGERSFTGSDSEFRALELKRAETGGAASQRPTTRFQSHVNLPTTEGGDTTHVRSASQNTSIILQGSSDLATFQMGHRSDILSSPHSSSASTDRHQDVQEMEDLDVDQGFDYSSRLDQVADWIANFSRKAESLEENVEETKAHMQEQRLAIMRQQGICESLQNRLELASSENAQLEDALRNETEEHSSTRDKFESQTQTLRSKMKDQEECLAKKEKAILERKNELLHLHRRLEEEIVMRTEISIERDGFCCQVTKLKEDLASERKSSASNKERDKAKYEDAEKLHEEQMTKNAYTIKQLQEKNSESHHEMGQLRQSRESLSKINRVLRTNNENIAAGIKSISDSVVCFSKVVYEPENYQDWKPPITDGGVSEGSHQTGPPQVIGFSNNKTNAEGKTVVFSDHIRQLSRKLICVFETALRRQTELTADVRRSKAAVGDVWKACLSYKGIVKEFQESILRMKEYIRCANDEKTKLNNAVRVAREDWNRYRKKLSEICKALELEDAAKKGTLQALDSCKMNLESANNEKTIALETLAAREERIRKLTTVEAKTLKECEVYKENLEKCRAERQKLLESRVCEMTTIQKQLGKEKAEAQQAIRNFEKCKTELRKAKELAARDQEMYKLEFARVMRMKKAECSTFKPSQPGCNVDGLEAVVNTDDWATKQRTEAEVGPQLEKKGVSLKPANADFTKLANPPNTENHRAIHEITQPGPSCTIVTGQVQNNSATRSPEQNTAIAMPRLMSKKRHEGKDLSKTTAIKKSRSSAFNSRSRSRKRALRKSTRTPVRKDTDESENEEGDDDDWFLPYE